MKLTTVRITNYKSIEDSGEFSIGDLTCLAGKNESGKTAILQALRRLNPVEESERSFDRTMEFPRARLHESDEGGDELVLRTTWELCDDDVAAVEERLGVGTLNGREVTISKGYGADSLTWRIPLDERKLIEHLADESGVSATARERIVGLDSVAAVSDAIEKAGERATKGEQQLLEELNSLHNGRPVLAAADVLRERLPKFLYFPTYEAMPGRIGVESLLARIDGDGEVTRGEDIFLALLDLAGTSLDEVREQELSEALIAKLEGVSNYITREIFRYWSQNRHLKVRFDYREALPDDPETGHVFLTRVENTRHGVTVSFDERSTGFVWFFSFLIWFSVAERQYGDRLVILLDEPGLSLHGTAQADLLRYIKEKLLPKHQVIYTTHSPFMIDASDLLTVRTVEDVIGPGDQILGTKVGDKVLSTDADTIFPLRAVLGYELTQSLFVGEHTLLVEGPADLLYLRWASNELKRRGRDYLDERWTICPTGGIEKISSFVALFGGNHLHVAVVTDFHEGDKAKVERLRKMEILRSGHVFTANSYVKGSNEADIEDVLGRELYTALVNRAYELGDGDRLPDAAPADAPSLVVREVADHMLTVSPEVADFDHYFPAAYLVENWPALQDLPGVDAALTRFETLFRDLNGLLSS